MLTKREQEYDMLGSTGYGGKFKGKQDCDDGVYSKRTLQRAYELSFAALFKDTKGQKKYEASDVILVGSKPLSPSRMMNQYGFWLIKSLTHV